MSDERRQNAETEKWDGFEHLNSLTRDEAVGRLLACCGSNLWAQRMADRRPFEDARQLFEAADLVWWRLKREDWLEAFRSHPPIGGGEPVRETGDLARAWSEEEQASTHEAEPETLAEIARLNRDYESRFGYIYIVCATGKSAQTMLENLRRRFSNDADTELYVAAEEQRRITRLRLLKLLDEK